MDYSKIFMYLIESSIIGSIMAVLIFLIKISLGNKLNPRVIYCLWLLLIIKLIIPFGPESKLSVYNFFNYPESVSISMNNNLSNNPVKKDVVISETDAAHENVNSAANTEVNKEVNCEKVLVFIWIYGLLFMASYYFSGLCKIKKIIKTAMKKPDSFLSEPLKQCSALLIVKKPEILVTGEIEGPLVFGIINPVIILPDKITKELKEEDIKYIILHELCHVKRKDLVITVITSLIRIVYWFNPIILFSLNFLHKDMEIACDAEVLSYLNSDENVDYGHTLINVTTLINSSRVIPGSAGIMEKKSQLKRRIVMIGKNSKITRKSIIIGLIVVVLFGIMGLTGRITRGTSENIGSKSPEEFLKYYNLSTEKNPEQFKVTVPKSWAVNAGDYPEGLYWELANEFSKDAGLDLTKLKGSTVEVLRYKLTNGLLAEPNDSAPNYNEYPSTAVLMISNNKVVGSWLCFNTASVGPSVRKRYLTEITGLSFEDWVYKKGLFAYNGENTDLADLSPENLIKEYFSAVSSGTKKRANACLSPADMRESLTSNFQFHKKILYNTNFTTDNNLTEIIVSGKVIGIKFLDPKEPGIELEDLKNKTEVEAAITADIDWHDNPVISDGITVGYSYIKKYNSGWKLSGFGSGP